MEAVKRYASFVAAAVVAVAGFALGDYGVMAWLAAALLACLGVVLESPRWGTVATAALGLFSSLYLFQMKLEASGSSMCDVSAKVSCSVVNSSAASELFGIPIAVLGAGFFLGVALAAVFQPTLQHRLYQSVGVLAAVGCVYSVWLAFQAYQIGATCPMCMTIYAANGLLVLAAALGSREQGIPLFSQLPQVAQSGSALTIAITFAVVVLLGQTVYQSRGGSKAEQALQQLQNQPKDPAVQPPDDNGREQPAPAPPSRSELAETLQQLYVTPRGTVQLEGDEPVLGDPNAPYTIVEYACFGCPHCAQAFGHLKQLVAEEPSIQVRFRAFPLSGECNPGVNPGRPEVCRAAMAAQCATKQGKFWDYAGIVFANQHSLGDQLLAAAAQQVGLDFDAFSKCMADPTTLQEVQEDAASGLAMKIPGTPAMFVKGANGDDWVEVCFGADAVKAMVQAHKSGLQLLPPAGNMCPME
jgi:protein-disulfide isomerase